ncbi:MAG TPA: FAD-dependent oxidoreductase [Gemmataceae bacterium]|jgi:glycine/D-amino acid oxidase-like deaminating enzyme
MTDSCDALVIGGGFYGLYLAGHLAGRGDRVVLCEREAGLMRRASYANQARVHHGYHYPRSVLTAQRSRVNYPRFVEEFRPAIDDSFEKVYAVARRFSKVTADQFYESMRRIGADVRPAPKRLADPFDPAYVEGVFLTRECAFNAVTLRDLMAERVRRAGVDVRLRTAVRSVGPNPGGGVRVETDGPGGPAGIAAGQVFCCTYSGLNATAILPPVTYGGLTQPRVPLKHELTELALVEVPPPLRDLGVTVMDGPFFSVMPFPARGLHTLSHVRYTPHGHWYDGDGPYRPADAVFAEAARKTAFPHMVRDAARYLPAVAGCAYRESLWEVKTVLPGSEADDSRPILFRPDFGLPGYHLVMGGKIDNVYDIVDVIAQTLTPVGG